MYVMLYVYCTSGSPVGHITHFADHVCGLLLSVRFVCYWHCARTTVIPNGDTRSIRIRTIETKKKKNNKTTQRQIRQRSSIQNRLTTQNMQSQPPTDTTMEALLVCTIRMKKKKRRKLIAKFRIFANDVCGCVVEQ